MPEEDRAEVRLQWSHLTKVEIRLATGSVPDPPVELRATLEWAGRKGRDLRAARHGDPRSREELGIGRFGADRVATLEAWDPGVYRVRVAVYESDGNSFRYRPLATVPAAPHGGGARRRRAGRGRRGDRLGRIAERG